MSDREMVIEHVTQKMVMAFSKGALVDAQNMNAFIGLLEGLSEEEYQELAAEEPSGAIS